MSVYTLYNGDCLKELKKLPDNSIDSIVTDPPYGLSFMGKKWDYDVPSVEIWKECLRVLKPGGHLLAFAGTRTQHRMAVRIEDAGFEIRDMIAWVYGSGFPKSLNIGKAIDKSNLSNPTHLQARIDLATEIRNKRKELGITAKEMSEWFSHKEVTKNWERKDDGFRIPTLNDYNVLVTKLGIRDDWYEMVRAEDQRKSTVRTKIDRTDDGTIYGLAHNGNEYETTTETAKQWEGWGTALKPALEPITIARKPLSEKTVAANVLKWGTGAINIDDSRIPINPEIDDPRLGGQGSWKTGNMAKNVYEGGYSGEEVGSSTKGRFPANFIHDGSEEVVSLFPNTKAGGSVSGKEPSRTGDENTNCYGEYNRVSWDSYKDDGSAARFFYCAKASKKDRNEGLDDFEEKSIGAKGNGIGRVCATCGASSLEAHTCNCKVKNWINPPTKKNNHPTVKPTKLMQYLVKMVTPPDGTVLDPFMGSGSTGKAAVLEGYNFVGIELQEDFVEISKSRIEHAISIRENKVSDVAN